jgi:uncharacterized repeat protein (TIGR01451 family)
VINGGTAAFTFTVTNTGDSQLSNVAVADPLAAGCNRTIGSLATAAITSYTCIQTGVNASFTNTATVTGEALAGSPVTDSDSAAVKLVGPALVVQKLPDSQTIFSGGEADFSITVTNTGDITLTNVVVVDALAATCNFTVATLPPGQAAAPASCASPNVTASFTNTAVATGTVFGGSTTVSATDTARVVVDPSLNPPNRPSLISPPHQSLTNTQNVTFVWSASADTLTYTLNISGQALIDVPAPAVTRTVTLPDGVYTWTVRAIGEGNRTLGYTSTWQVTVDTTAPSAPAQIKPGQRRGHHRHHPPRLHLAPLG